MYGNVIAVLREEVKDRATIADGDSLSIESDLHQEFYEQDKTPRLRSHSFDRQGTSLPKFRGWQFFEAQIYGALRIQDVKLFLVNCPLRAAVPQKGIDQLRASGVPVHQCVDTQPPVRSGNRLILQNAVLTAGERL